MAYYLKNTMATEAERRICIAPLGQFQVVHIDPRDHWPTRESKPGTLEEARNFLSKMFTPARETMQVFNNQGEVVPN